MRLVLVFTLATACGPRPAGGERASLREVTVLVTADLHSHLFPERTTLTGFEASRGLGRTGETARVGGSARLASLVASERAANAATVLLDAGDALEGTALYGAFRGEPEMRVLDALGVDAQALGNHDLVGGEDGLSRLRARWARYPLLGANLDEQLATGLVTPFVRLEREGVSIAVVGVGRLPDRAPTLALTATAVQRAVDEVREATDVVVVLSHLGSGDDLDLVERTTGVDVVLGGHSHDVVEAPRSVRDCGVRLRERRSCRPRHVPVFHPGAHGRFLGVVRMTLSSDATDLAEVGPRPSVPVAVEWRLLPVTDDVPEDSGVHALLAPYRAALDASGAGEPLLFAPDGLSRAVRDGGDSPLGNFVTDAMRAVTGADLALVNTTGLRASLPAGVITAEQWYAALPFDDALVTVSLSGTALTNVFRTVAEASCQRDRRSQVQVSGVRLRLSCSAARVGITVGDRPIEPAGIYQAAVPSFLTGPGRWLEGAPETARSESPLREVLRGALGRLPPCAAPAPALPCAPGSGALAASSGRIDWE